MNNSHIRIDHETGLIHGLPDGPQPLVGPTTGSAYKKLQEDEKQNRQMKLKLERQMRSTWQCTQCKRKFRGKNIRVKWMNLDGVQTETLVCQDSHCDAPVIMIEDALDLRKIPGGIAC